MLHIVYVNTIVITGNDSDVVTWLKQFLEQHFHAKDLGELVYLLGIEG